MTADNEPTAAELAAMRGEFDAPTVKQAMNAQVADGTYGPEYTAGYETAEAGQAATAGHTAGWYRGHADALQDARDTLTPNELAEILSAQNQRLARESNIDPRLPEHGDMSRCTDSAPCGDAGCCRCVPPGPDWWVRAIAGTCSHGGHGWDGETCSDAPAELVDCEECGAPCDGTLTAYSELFDEDMPVCPDCHVMCTLVSPDEVTAIGLRGEAEDTSAEDAYAAQYLATDGFTREADDFSQCAPMFAAIEPGMAWLRAQDSGLVTYSVYGGADYGEVVLISLDLEFAQLVAGWRTKPYGEPICRSERMCGTWLYDDRFDTDRWS
jgi:hypothetical protein